jgi:hypothetical protein
VEVGSSSEARRHFIALRGGADGPAGLLLAVNPASISHISSAWSKEYRQSMLRLHLNNGRQIGLFEEGANDVLEALGLSEFVEDWVLDLNKDVG